VNTSVSVYDDPVRRGEMRCLIRSIVTRAAWWMSRDGRGHPVASRRGDFTDGMVPGVRDEQIARAVERDIFWSSEQCRFVGSIGAACNPENIASALSGHLAPDPVSPDERALPDRVVIFCYEHSRSRTCG